MAFWYNLYYGKPVVFNGGTPFYQQANASQPYHRFTGGTLFYGIPSALQNTRLFDTNLGLLGSPYIGVRSGYSDTGPKLGPGQNRGVNIALAGGTFATMVQDKYVLMTYTNQLAGVANTVLNSPSKGVRKSQNTAISWVNTWFHQQVGGWYVLNGKLITSAMSRDNIQTETYPGTLAIPGRLTYNGTGSTATTKSYAQRND